MINIKLKHFKHYYVDSVDPENIAAKLAFRTALACALSILLFQWWTNIFLSTWAGFATFAIVQNDTQELFLQRLYFLITVTCILALAIFTGMTLGHYPGFFILTVPLVIFVCAYASCFGFSYFNAGSWIAFLYVFAGANPVDVKQAAQIAGVVLMCGVLSLFVCFFVLPNKPYQFIRLSYQRVLEKLLVLMQSYRQGETKYIAKFYSQLDGMLMLQEKNLRVYLEAANVSDEKKKVLASFAKTFYQISLVSKSMLRLQHHIAKHPSCRLTEFVAASQLIEDLLSEVILQYKTRQLPDFISVNKKLEVYRENLTVIRVAEIAKPAADYAALLDYSNYFYHLKKIIDLLHVASDDIAHLCKLL